MRVSTSSRSCWPSAQRQLVSTRRLFAFVRWRSRGATCCSRSSTDGGRTLRLFALTAVTRTSSFDSTRATARGHRLFRLARSGARIIGAGVDATLDPARLESDLDSYPVAGILIG